jgi:hypothetical protein
MTPEMYSSSLVAMSVMAAMGRPQFAIWYISLGPIHLAFRAHLKSLKTEVQRLQDPRSVYLNSFSPDQSIKSRDLLKKYCLAAGDFAQLMNPDLASQHLLA